MLDLTKIVPLHDGGSSNMGSLAFGETIDGTEDDNDKARFWLPDTRFVLLSVRVHFRSGADRAPFVVNLDSGLGKDYDMALMTLVPDVGTGKDVHFRVDEQDMQHWICDGTRNDRIVLTWANPNDGIMRWGAEVFLYPVDASTSL